MPSKNQHIKRAYLNEEFAQEILSLDNKFMFWALVAFHYSALHWVDAYLATINEHPMSHYIRDKCLSRVSHLRKIYSKYHQLQTDSRDSRYNIHSFKARDISDARDYLYSIKSHLQSVL